MAGESTPQAVALKPSTLVAPTPAADEPSSAVRAELARQVKRQMAIVLPIVNMVFATITFVFVDYIVPLPGNAQPTRERGFSVLVMVIASGIAWVTCDVWSRRGFAPVRVWLERGGEPSESERARALRFPVHEAGRTLAVWALVGLGFGIADVALDGAVVAGVLIAAMVVLGGLSVSALSYLATERVLRPVTALALRSDPPTQPMLPGIAGRIYLAWEFGTAVSIGGIVVVTVAYLSGAGISPHRVAATVIFLAALALTIGVMTLLAAVRSVADPVRGMRRAMARVEAGDTEITVPVNDGSEIGLLQAGFNRMVAGLRERDRVRDLFGRHVGEDVARSALGRGHELGGELREAAVLFVDVVGSTSFASERDPHEVVETLNRFFGIVVEVVTLHGGWVNKFEGDAALCAFGAPTDHPDPAGAALAAGREMRRRLAQELDGLDAAIGLSCGTVVAGNIGAAERYEYTLIGDTVNEAARLSELAKSNPCRLLASQAIVERAGEREAARWALGESVELRGRHEATRIASPAEG